jgi:hypothetical protein
VPTRRHPRSVFRDGIACSSRRAAARSLAWTWWLAAGLAALLGQGQVGALAASPAAPVTLGGVNTISGQSSAIEILVPRPATIGQSELASFSAVGSGRVVGFVLTNGSGSVFRALQFNGCWTAGCRPGALDAIFDPSPPPGAPITLTPGPYRLYLVGDGGLVSVTFRLGGLTGRVSLSPSEAVSIQTLTLVNVLPAAANPVVFSGGGTGRVGDLGGLGFALMRLGPRQQAPAVSGGLGLCIYGPSATAPAFVPGCPGGDWYSAPAEVDLPSSGSLAISTDAFLFRELTAGSWSIGGYYDGLSPSVPVGGIVMWLSYSSGSGQGASATVRPTGLPLTAAAPPTPAAWSLSGFVAVILAAAFTRRRQRGSER